MLRKINVNVFKILLRFDGVKLKNTLVFLLLRDDTLEFSSILKRIETNK